MWTPKPAPGGHRGLLDTSQVCSITQSHSQDGPASRGPRLRPSLPPSLLALVDPGSHTAPCFPFQCYKVSCLEIPGPPGPKGYRGQKVRHPDHWWGRCHRKAPDLSPTPYLRATAPWMDSPLLTLEDLKFSFYQLPFLWHFQKSRNTYKLRFAHKILL